MHDNVSENTLLFLSYGYGVKEERIFIYEDSSQIWW